MTRARLIIMAAMLFPVLLAAYGHLEATRDPIVRSVRLADPDWPADARPMSLLLVSDTHVQGPDMPPARLRRIVTQINTLEPDVIVLAGDYTASHWLATRTYTIREAVEPLRALTARIAIVAVLGNHDRSDPEEARAALQSIGVTVLEDDAVQLGPLAIGGIRRRIPPALRQLRQLQGTKIVVAHSPAPFPRLPSSIPLMLAGHTHCGQVVIPLIGALVTESPSGRRYNCGIVQEWDKTLLVTAGLGTSRLPLRIGAPPDMWLITLGPEALESSAVR